MLRPGRKRVVGRTWHSQPKCSLQGAGSPCVVRSCLLSCFPQMGPVQGVLASPGLQTHSLSVCHSLVFLGAKLGVAQLQYRAVHAISIPSASSRESGVLVNPHGESLPWYCLPGRWEVEHSENLQVQLKEAVWKGKGTDSCSSGNRGLRASGLPVTAMYGLESRTKGLWGLFPGPFMVTVPGTLQSHLPWKWPTVCMESTA